MSSDSDGPGDGPLNSGSFDPEDELTPEQIKAVYLFLAGCSVSETAGKIGCHRATVSRWKNSDAYFRAAYNRARKTRLQQPGPDLARRVRAAAAVLLAASEDEVELIDKLLQKMGLLDR